MLAQQGSEQRLPAIIWVSSSSNRPEMSMAIERLKLVVDDIAAARGELLDRGVEVGEVQEFPWGSFVFFSDLDGNGWSVQQLPSRN